MNEKLLTIPFDAPLIDLDTELQTYGCRHTNPDICSSNSMANVCAFVRADCICKKPSRAWKRQYKTLADKN